MSPAFFDIAGLAGVALILGAYILMQLDYLNNRQIRFQLMNLIGALLIMVSLLHFWNLASFLMELAWGSISAWGLWKIIRKKQ